MLLSLLMQNNIVSCASCNPCWYREYLALLCVKTWSVFVWCSFICPPKILMKYSLAWKSTSDILGIRLLHRVCLKSFMAITNLSGASLSWSGLWRPDGTKWCGLSEDSGPEKWESKWTRTSREIPFYHTPPANPFFQYKTNYISWDVSYGEDRHNKIHDHEAINLPIDSDHRMHIWTGMLIWIILFWGWVYKIAK